VGLIKVIELDHIVLNVADVDRTLRFYTGVLGLKGERVEEFREGKVGFPSVRINEHTVIDFSPGRNAPETGERALRNLNHFCLVMDRGDFPVILDYLRDQGIQILVGPVSRWGAQGRATSVYILDPDGNEVELRCY